MKTLISHLRRWRLGPAGAMLLILFGGAFAYLAVVSEPSPRWRARYELGVSNVLVTAEHDLDHRSAWAPGRGGDGGKDGGFLAEWDTCLRIDRSGSVAFQLTSSGRARAYIDGRPVIDDWALHNRRTRGVELALEPGHHHLRITYEAPTQGAAIILAASFDERRPARIPPNHLSFPTEDLDAPCTER
jgi:hypothetical protein